LKLPSLKIKNIHVPRPIIQGGMGVGISWDNLAGNVAKNGCIGIVSGVCTGYRYPDFVKTFQGRPLSPANLHHRESLIRIVKRAKEIAEGNGAVGVNILYCITDYGRVVRDAIDAGADLIISGAGIPLRLPEYAGDADIALIPIVSSARVLGIICNMRAMRISPSFPLSHRHGFSASSAKAGSAATTAFPMRWSWKDPSPADTRDIRLSSVKILNTL